MKKDPITGIEVVIENYNAYEFKNFLTQYVEDKRSSSVVIGVEQDDNLDDSSVPYI